MVHIPSLLGAYQSTMVPFLEEKSCRSVNCLCVLQKQGLMFGNLSPSSRSFPKARIGASYQRRHMPLDLLSSLKIGGVGLKTLETVIIKSIIKAPCLDFFSCEFTIPTSKPLSSPELHRGYTNQSPETTKVVDSHSSI